MSARARSIECPLHLFMKTGRRRIEGSASHRSAPASIRAPTCSTDDDALNETLTGELRPAGLLRNLMVRILLDPTRSGVPTHLGACPVHPSVARRRV